MGAHATVLAASLSATAARLRRGQGALVAAAVACGGAAVWFSFVQALVVRAFCPYCLAAHACGVTVATLVLARQPVALRPSAFVTWITVGLAAVAVLAAGQWFGPAVEARVFRHGPGRDRPRGPNTMVFHDGDVQIEPGDFPVAGPADAPHHFALFTDYTCPHCRRLHGILARAADRRPGRFNVVVLPMPLSPGCNPHMTQTPAGHEHACELARLALAVWRADPKAFTRMDEWLAADEDRAPDPAAARAFAVRLVGGPAMEKAEADPWVAQTLGRSVEMFNRDTRSSGTAVPKLMFPSATLAGPADDPGPILKELDRALGG